MPPVRLIIVGGFLGAGKTTLLFEAAKRLAAQGRRVGLITNDQAPDLVDTHFLKGGGFHVEEVAGSCFCCNFTGLIDSAEKLRHDVDADVLIAEPVGSCTDLSATILQPLKDSFRQTFELAPLSVLADPFRLRQILTGQPGRMHPDAAYIFEKQLEEADVIVCSKADRSPENERAELEAKLAGVYPDRPVQWVSSRTGEGFDAWLTTALTETAAGSRIPEVDYDKYAHGEAIMGWVNATARITASGIDAQAVCGALLTYLKNEAASRNAEIGHIKALLTAGNTEVAGNLTAIDAQHEIRTAGSSKADIIELTLNARVEMAPEELETLCRAAIETAANGGSVTIETLHSLSPGRPIPTHRYSNVVK
jgi:G3E family GTPase